MGLDTTLFSNVISSHVSPTKGFILTTPSFGLTSLGNGGGGQVEDSGEFWSPYQMATDTAHLQGVSTASSRRTPVGHFPYILHCPVNPFHLLCTSSAIVVNPFSLHLTDQYLLSAPLCWCWASTEGLTQSLP